MIGFQPNQICTHPVRGKVTPNLRSTPNKFVIRTSSNDRQFSTQINVNETRTQVSTIPRKSPIRLHQLKYNVVSQSHKKLPSNTVLGPLFQAKSKLTKQSKLPQINDSKDEVTNETIRAKSFLVFDNLEEKCLESMNPLMRLEMASLTKIMTFYTIIKFFQESGVDFLDLNIEVSLKATQVDGTSAGLQYQDEISVKDLMYGMMLPSGNDAATCLAEAFGVLMFSFQKIPICLLIVEGCLRVETVMRMDVLMFFDPERYFILKMNDNCRGIGMQNTVFTSSHGNADDTNFSCAEDLLKLCRECQDLKDYRMVVACIKYRAKGRYHNYKWRNTNKLLSLGFDGIKTGFTEGAGPCLCASYNRLDFLNIKQASLIIILLGCETAEQRWKDCNKIVKKYDSQGKRKSNGLRYYLQQAHF